MLQGTVVAVYAMLLAGGGSRVGMEDSGGG